MKLELRGITKRFGGLVANDHIDLVVEPGEILALLGENGAGKTTLMNVLYGLIQPDEGEILIADKPVHIRSPKDAINSGIGMVHQHFMLVPVFTVAENVTLGTERVRRARIPALHVGPVSLPALSVPTLGLLDRRRARRDVLEMSERYGLQVDPDAHIEDLPVGVQQRVEIIKALLRNASVLVLDALSQILPDNTYVTELHLAGNKLQIVGITRDAPSLIPLIEQSPHFTRATFYAPTTRSPSDPGERFHIEMKVEPKNTVAP